MSSGQQHVEDLEQELEAKREQSPKAYAIHDSKIGAFTAPFFVRNEGLAIRSFERAAMNPEQTMHTHPADFTLFEIGWYDEQTGSLVGEQPRSIINGIHLPMWAAKGQS